MNDVASRAVKAVVVGLVTAFVVFIILLVVSAILPSVSLDAAKWGMIVGVLAGLYSFLTGNNVIE